ncbi:MAG: type II secretion system protein GspG [Bryobacteraceae bacterium]
MLIKVVQGALISVAACASGAFVILGVGKKPAWAVAGPVITLFMSWLAWATWRAFVLCRRGAFRRTSAAWDREDFGFAAGALAGGGFIVVALALFPFVRGHDVRTITAGPEQVFKMALESYRRDVGQYPSATQGLGALTIDPGVKGWAGPYVASDCRRYVDWFEYRVHGDDTPILVPHRPRSPR